MWAGRCASEGEVGGAPLRRAVLSRGQPLAGMGPWVWGGVRAVWLKGNREREAGGTGEPSVPGRAELGKDLGARGASLLTGLHPFLGATAKTKPRSLS